MFAKIFCSHPSLARCNLGFSSGNFYTKCRLFIIGYFFVCEFCTTSGPPRDRMGLPVGKMEPQQVEMYPNPTKHAPIKVLKIIIETISC